MCIRDRPYVSAITTTLSDRCDYAMHIKVYGTNPEDERRYSPAEVISSEKVPVIGNPDKKRICTSHVERQNLTIRMQMRRMTRLTNAFSKKWDNLWSAYCLWFAFYNFCRIHTTIRTVSYTHLDVYKRQSRSQARLGFLIAACQLRRTNPRVPGKPLASRHGETRRALPSAVPILFGNWVSRHPRPVAATCGRDESSGCRPP